MEATTSIVLPDFLPYLLAIFGLLVLWQFYQLRVMKGRILAIDIFERSGVRMYLYAVADDLQACQVCRAAHGMVFPPSKVMKSQFYAKAPPVASASSSVYTAHGPKRTRSSSDYDCPASGNRYS